MLETPFRVTQMCAIFISEQTLNSYTSDYQYAMNELYYWERRNGVVYCYKNKLQLLNGNNYQQYIEERAKNLLYTVYIGLIDYDPCIFWTGYEWRKIDDLNHKNIDLPFMMDNRYRWLICYS
jgi:hypothetical protein